MERFTVVGSDQLSEVLNETAKLIACDFADEGEPEYGCAYYRWIAYKLNRKFYIVEYNVNADKTGLDCVVKLVDY